MARGWMSANDAKKTFAELDKLSGGGSSFNHTLADINYELSFLLLAIKQLKYLVDGKQYLAFINKENDEVAKENGSEFSILQVQFLRGVVEAIAMDQEAEHGIGSISGIEALNVHYAERSQASQGTNKSLSLHEKEAALSKFVDEGWLSELPGIQGHYTIGVRTFLELNNQLLDFDLPAETRQSWIKFL